MLITKYCYYSLIIAISIGLYLTVISIIWLIKISGPQNGIDLALYLMLIIPTLIIITLSLGISLGIHLINLYIYKKILIKLKRKRCKICDNKIMDKIKSENVFNNCKLTCKSCKQNQINNCYIINIIKNYKFNLCESCYTKVNKDLDIMANEVVVNA